MQSEQSRWSELHSENGYLTERDRVFSFETASKRKAMKTRNERNIEQKFEESNCRLRRSRLSRKMIRQILAKGSEIIKEQGQTKHWQTLEEIRSSMKERKGKFITRIASEIRRDKGRRCSQQAIKARSVSRNQSVVKDQSFDAAQFVV